MRARSNGRASPPSRSASSKCSLATSPSARRARHAARRGCICRAPAYAALASSCGSAACAISCRPALTAASILSGAVATANAVQLRPGTLEQRLEPGKRLQPVRAGKVGECKCIHR